MSAFIVCRCSVYTRSGWLCSLLLYVRKNEPLPNLSLQELLMPIRFDLVIKSVKGLATKEGKDVAALPLRIGQIISMMIATLHGQSIRTGDLELEDNCKRFSALMNAEWSNKISMKSRKKLHDRKLNKTLKIPDKDSVTQLAEELEYVTDDHHAAFKKDPNADTGRKLAESLLCQIIVFNKRRGGEAARLEADPRSAAR